MKASWWERFRAARREKQRMKRCAACKYHWIIRLDPTNPAYLDHCFECSDNPLVKGLREALEQCIREKRKRRQDC